MADDIRDIKEAMHYPPRIRAACLWGDALEYRLDFDAAYWFQYFDDDVLMVHFESAIHIPMVDGDVTLSIDDAHPEWGCLELVTELPEAYPGLDDMVHWLAVKGAVGYAEIEEDEEEQAEIASEYIAIYLCRADALAWLRMNRPELYADIKSVYSLPPPEACFFT